jgi:hypothetical protein
LVEGGALLRPIGNGDGVVGATLAFTGLGGVGAIAVLAVVRWSIASWMCRVFIPLARTIHWVAVILVMTMGALGILHVGVLDDDGHHVRDGLGITLDHLPP